MKPMITILPGPDAAASASADRLIQVAEKARQDNRLCAIALAGGSTPPRMYAELVRRTRDGQIIPWDCITFYWGDDRAVPPDHPDSNYRLAKEHLFTPIDFPEDRVFRMPAERKDLEQAASDYEAILRRQLPASDSQPPWPVFDLIYLGMGPDGHTASLFPGTKSLTERDRAVMMYHVPAVKMDRMTLTYPVINAARSIVMEVVGQSKAERVRDVLGGGVPPGTFPVQGVQPVSGSLEWILDEAAASLLDAP